MKNPGSAPHRITGIMPDLLGSGYAISLAVVSDLCAGSLAGVCWRANSGSSPAGPTWGCVHRNISINEQAVGPVPC
jgi:hypothetical protein